MTKTLAFLFTLAIASALAARVEDHGPGGPEIVVVQSGTLKLHALLWHPPGHGPFPAVLFNHGSGNTPENQAAQAAGRRPRLRQTWLRLALCIPARIWALRRSGHIGDRPHGPGTRDAWTGCTQQVAA